METIQGILVRSQSGFYEIDTNQGPYTARLRGKHKRGRKTGDLLAVGDIVHISLQDDGSAMIEEIEERKNKLSRLAPTARGEYEQIIIANPDQAVLTFACTQPDPRMRMLDRFLIIAEEQKIPILIVANKTDLVGMSKAKKLFGHYRDLGYELVYTSVNKNRGIRTLHDKLKGKISVFAGPSGVGKSSLLNAIQPKLGLQVNTVSKSNRKGKHTTVVREMFPLKDGGYVADTPGLKALALWDIEPEELDAYFPEIRPLVPDCQFSSCTHIQEPGCAVLEALEKGSIHPERYESYVRLRYGDDE
ncbi:MAG: ribosome small subunit-dependent GTPase A [Chloroflexi bacterium]|jgi:ribosome biogenesis GTPase / thiamine phosphate phosphatase|nr:ribosome small subunit-dependent GTPase A [Chloroflexota bacterium]MBT3671219.1 ribosome small subunit-dependent GTPase A [Chloroflexota bacterium]MBT4003539.1 ribosome small subunit-dependent GTPase A [Chloroflexota bacterium]MBT4304322.1 ribosome small subunit-dependent GTPase A [Chloroflexota bacterium]MBT4534341.1 ribosome small subunit-dependent GTPase A [Chloroflexota bacterium]